jgi:hypothetical protein
MLNWIPFFNSSSADVAPAPKDTHTNPSPTQLSEMLQKLSLQEMVNWILRLPPTQVVELWPLLATNSQNHVFPLLPDHIRNQVYDVSSEERQTELLIQLDGFSKSQRQAENDINHPSSFFYCMQAWNTKKAKHQSKTTYMVRADQLMKFDLKPFKYQRRLMDHHIACISKGILQSKVLFHPIILAYIKPRESLTIVDGQHRWQALKRLVTDAEGALVLKNLYVQIDVIDLPDNDTEIMTVYKYINTNVPIDASKLHEELRYVDLVDKIKAVFPKGIETYRKDIKDSVPQHFVVDSWLKEEMQYREMLSHQTEDMIIAKLMIVNEEMKASVDRDSTLSALERRMCKREGMYLGIAWPSAINRLEQLLQ